MNIESLNNRRYSKARQARTDSRLIERPPPTDEYEMLDQEIQMLEQEITELAPVPDDGTDLGSELTEAPGRPDPKDTLTLRFFDEWGHRADGALLLQRPRNSTELPVPLQAVGLDGTTQAEMNAVYHNVSEMCQPTGFTEVGLIPALTVFASNGASWICAASPAHYVLMRVSQRHQFVMAVGFMTRLMKEMAE